ncbi:MAG TPA: hypothetical protein VH599_02645 [Ktedonobacterales bacterium]|jgi:hypothetical protein
MLAYFFTHWPLESIPSEHYEAALRSFHQSLAAHPPQGFHQSWVIAVQGLPWANRGLAAYEDWYLVDDFAALGVVNEAAVSAPHQETHTAVARMTGAGKGGVYALVQGACEPAQIRYAAWFGKPAGMTYAACLQQLATITNQPGAALWLRQMVLGPGLEFCLHTAHSLALPEAFQALQVEVRQV